MAQNTHSAGLRQVLEALETHPDRGLTEAEAEKRLEQYGPNQLETAKPPGLLRRCLAQLKDPMVLVLLAAAALSWFAGGGRDWLDAAIILVIVTVNTVISVAQEDNARKALEALDRLSAPRAKVVRDGAEQSLDSSRLVPGDVILLEAGDYIPADGRVLWEAGLQTDESAMTGESVPVHKRAGGGLAPETPLAERRNMVLGGTVVTVGRGKAVVTATGMDTEMGKIAGLLLTQSQGETPLQKKMKEVSQVLSLVCVGVCALMFGVGMLQHRDLPALFLTAVALAVAAIPEGLPAIVTIVLAMGVGKMAKRNAIVRRLPAVETLGCASVICSDKTGTLTQNRMTAESVWPTVPALSRRVLLLGTLCSDARQGEEDGTFLGDPTETAIAARARSEGLDKPVLDLRFPRQGEAPFDSGRKRMATCHKDPDGGCLSAVKGAPEAVLACCTKILTPNGPRPLNSGDRRRVREQCRHMAREGLRVLAAGERRTEVRPADAAPEVLERDLTFVGLVGLLDPPRTEAGEAVAKCAGAGVRAVMITGDHRDTAVAVARKLGILRDGDRALDGPELDLLSQELLEENVGRFSVYARVTPEHKLRIVRAWQKRGCVVAMTGDGVNDAPALRAADIGCAVGKTGTDVAKGAADMILTDDNFATLAAAVEQGRAVYANIRKAIHYLLSCNIGEILAIFIATVAPFLEAPLTPVQLLWLNLVTDSLPALALGMEPVEQGVMDRPPRRRDEPLFSKAFSLGLAWQGALVGGLTLLAYALGLRWAGPAAANTMAFAALTLSQLFHAFDVRSEDRSLLRVGIFSNPAMNRAFLAGLALQLAVLLLPPLQGAFGVTAMDPRQWGAVLALAVTPLLVCETGKAIRGARRKTPAAVRETAAAR